MWFIVGCLDEKWTGIERLDQENSDNIEPNAKGEKGKAKTKQVKEEL